jgi:hypothetical protein
MKLDPSLGDVWRPFGCSTIKRHAHDLAVASHPAAQLALLVE